jgi:hypothetical protein
MVSLLQTFLAHEAPAAGKDSNLFQIGPANPRILISPCLLARNAAENATRPLA